MRAVDGDQEITPGGSRIYRYGEVPDTPRLGPSEQEFGDEREAYYESLWGAYECVSHEVIRLDPHIDVYMHTPTDERDFHTLVTGGMSDRAMSDGSRAELLLYTAEADESYIGLLRHYARLVHDLETTFGAFHTITNGDPPAPLFPDSELDTLFLIPPIVEPERSRDGELELDGVPLQLLWVVPITNAEAQLKLDRGADELLDLLDERQHPVVLDPRRASYV